jgi:hypothetical protein
MRITNIEIYPARKPSFLANARVELSDNEGNSLTITDFRILRNKQSDLWVAVPNYTIPDGKGWIYEPTVILSRKLQFEISEAVLAVFAKWQQPIGQKPLAGGAR